MNNLNTTKTKHVILLSVLVGFLALIFTVSIDLKAGDSAIYFPFLKHFFTLPFSYDGVSVEHGATSTLWVIFNAPLFWLFGFENWMVVARLIGFTLVFTSAILIAKRICSRLALSYTAQVFTYLFSVVIVSLNVPLIMSVSALFETSFVIFVVTLALVYHDDEDCRPLVILAALLPLVRPDLAVLSAYIMIRLFYKRREQLFSLNSLMLAFIAVLPTIVVYGYLAIASGELVPSSVMSRVILIDSQGDYLERLIISAKALFFAWPVYLIALFFLASLYSAFKHKDTAPIILLIIFIGLFVISPPGNYVLRYSQLMSPLVIYLIVSAFAVGLIRINKTIYNIVIGAVLIVMGGIPIALYALMPGFDKYTFDELLLKDLAIEIEELSETYKIEYVNVAIYEVQAQFYLEGRAVSLDGVTGGEIFGFLKKEEPLSSFIVNNNINFLVINEAMNTRAEYNDTEIELLYIHHWNNPVGEIIKIDGICYMKVRENQQNFDLLPLDGLIYGDNIRVYSLTDANWGGHAVLWGSIYYIQECN